MRIPSTFKLSCLAGFAAAGLLAASVMAQTADQSDMLSHSLKSKDAAGAWAELQGAGHPPPSPKEWETTKPTMEQRQKFYLPYVAALTDKAKDFYSRFPADSHASDAKMLEFRYLTMTVAWGDAAQQSRLDKLQDALLKDPGISSDEHYGILWSIAENATPEKAAPLLKEIVNGAAPERMKKAAQDQLAKMGRIGEELKVAFTAVDGRNVDLAKLKGKVVLLDFWATWCGPCVGEVPNVKKTYDKFHSKGFEIVGISLDKDKDKLTQFVAENKMEWPQYFDGKQWQNDYARQFGIDSIPSMWLIDKKGKLRNINAREDLGGGVEKLLAE